MVAEDLFVVVSRVPERISKYVSDLRLFTSNFLFFSDVRSFAKKTSLTDVKLIILDGVGDDASVVEQVRQLRHLSASELGVILVIVQTGDNENGVAALSAGANDYLTYPLVNKELAVRTRMHLNSDGAKDIIADFDIDLKNIYPREDRFIIRTAIYYIKNNLATIRRAGDLFVCLEKATER